MFTVCIKLLLYKNIYTPHPADQANHIVLRRYWQAPSVRGAQDWQNRCAACGCHAAAAGEEDPYSKIKNAMLYCRRMWADCTEFREQYQTPNMAAEIEADNKVSKLPKGSEERCLAEGNLIWRKCLDGQQKTAIRHAFLWWKEERERQGLVESLVTDYGGGITVAGILDTD